MRHIRTMATGAGVIKGVAIPAVNFAALALGYTNKSARMSRKSNMVETVAVTRAITNLNKAHEKFRLTQTN